MKAAKKTKRTAALLGLGLDCDDGHTQEPRGEDFVLFGGSQDTHAQMQETAIKFKERLDRRGRRLEDVSVDELRDIWREVHE